MVGKYAQCVFLLMLNWLGECPSASCIPWDLHSHHRSMIRGGGDSREPREHGHCELGQSAVTITSRRSRQVRALLPHSSPFFWHERWFGALHDGFAHPKCAMGTTVPLQWKKAASHVLTTGYVLFTVWCHWDVFKCGIFPQEMFLSGRHLTACLNVV